MVVGCVGWSFVVLEAGAACHGVSGALSELGGWRGSGVESVLGELELVGCGEVVWGSWE